MRFRVWEVVFRVLGTLWVPTLIINPESIQGECFFRFRLWVQGLGFMRI